MHQWSLLKKLYEKGNLHLANLSRVIKQALFFQLPSVKQNQKLYETQINQLSQKNIDYSSSSKNHLATLQSQLAKLGVVVTMEQVQSMDIRGEVARQQRHLPALFEDIVLALGDSLLTKGIQYYY